MAGLPETRRSRVAVMVVRSKSSGRRSRPGSRPRSTCFALGRAFQQHRVGVVDVGVDLGWARQPGQLGKASVRSGDRLVIHFPRPPVADAERNQLIVGPEGPVEQQQVGLPQALEQQAVQLAAPGDDRRRSPPLASSRRISPTVCPAAASPANRGGPAGTSNGWTEMPLGSPSR